MNAWRKTLTVAFGIFLIAVSGLLLTAQTMHAGGLLGDSLIPPPPKTFPPDRTVPLNGDLNDGLSNAPNYIDEVVPDPRATGQVQLTALRGRFGWIFGYELHGDKTGLVLLKTTARFSESGQSGRNIHIVYYTWYTVE